MMLLYPPDGFLIDYVFQPVVNRWSKRGSCFDMARFCLDGAGVFVVVQMLRVADRLTLDAIVLGVLLVSATIVVRHALIGMIERKTTAEQNPGRFLLVGMRVMTIIVLLVNAREVSFDWTGVTMILMSVLFMNAAYFTSCRLVPPPEKEPETTASG